MLRAVRMKSTDAGGASGPETRPKPVVSTLPQTA